MIHCRFDMLENFTLQLSSIKIGPAYEQNHNIISRRKMMGSTTPAYRTIAQLELLQSPDVGQIFKLDGHPYIVHEISWSASNNDNADLHAYISLVDVKPQDNPLRKNIDCCDDIGEEDIADEEMDSEVEEMVLCAFGHREERCFYFYAKNGVNIDDARDHWLARLTGDSTINLVKKGIFSIIKSLEEVPSNLHTMYPYSMLVGECPSIKNYFATKTRLLGFVLSSSEPQPSTAIDYDAKREELRKTLYELAGKFNSTDFTKFAAESRIL